MYSCVYNNNKDHPVLYGQNYKNSNVKLVVNFEKKKKAAHCEFTSETVSISALNRNVQVLSAILS